MKKLTDAINKDPRMSFILVDKDGDWFGEADYTRWNELPWYKQLWGNIFYSYKRKYIDMKGFEVKGGYQNDSLIDAINLTIKNMKNK